MLLERDPPPPPHKHHTVQGVTYWFGIENDGISCLLSPYVYPLKDDRRVPWGTGCLLSPSIPFRKDDIRVPHPMTSARMLGLGISMVLMSPRPPTSSFFFFFWEGGGGAGVPTSCLRTPEKIEDVLPCEGNIGMIIFDFVAGS